ncbi:unnamed protein product [Notodromas monacha]|uniref:Anoctamin n=1 Tax=Notodromas monacha TaxID=399045 RepID=A0A7R9GGL3_9CRUS|nr:unnamed protein product [Notodromas monacha]CAG0920037.1 unnamed protein product [Notodromas monacha]
MSSGTPRNYVQMLLFKDRLKTFDGVPWPKEHPSPQKMAEAGFFFIGNKDAPDMMAEAGFFFIGNKDAPDMVKCPFCLKEMDCWESEDDPWHEHGRKKSSCAFLSLGRKPLTFAENFKLHETLVENSIVIIMAGHEIDLETSALEEFVRCNDLMNESADELETLVVLEFDPRTPEETLRWLYGKLTGDAESGGSELIVKAHIEEHALSFHVTASTLRLLEIAEGVSMRRRALDGKVRVFSMAEGHYFVGKESRPRDLFTTAELQRFVSIAMDDLRITLPDTQLGMKTFPGLSIPVSEGTPIDDVREYFGESLGLYFSFFHFYLKSLIFPAVAGPMLFFLCNIFGIPAGYAVVISCVTNLLWITVFFELWKRKNASLTYDWGTHDIHSYHEPLRPGFHGEMIRLKNGKLELRYPRWKTMCKEYLVSYPVMGILAAVYLGLIYIETLANEFVYAVQFDEDPGYGRYLVYFPSIAYGVIIYLLSQPTRQFAAFLTSWENHATQNAWDMHLMIKLAVVEFVNLFASLFYIGFYLQNWDSLRMQLAMLLLVHAFLENISEHVIPYLNQKSAVKEIQSSLSDFVKEKTGYDILHNESCEGKMKLPSYIPRMDPNAWEVRQAREDSGKPPYESKYDNYSEIWAQFGYAFMFSAVLPWTGMFCIVANCFEIVC